MWQIFHPTLTNHKRSSSDGAAPSDLVATVWLEKIVFFGGCRCLEHVEERGRFLGAILSQDRYPS
jgi:hypothetical protein